METTSKEKSEEKYVCYECGEAAETECKKCNKYFCELHGNTNELRCEKCDGDYCF